MLIFEERSLSASYALHGDALLLFMTVTSASLELLVKGCDFHDPMYLLVLSRAEQKGKFSRSRKYTFLLSNFSVIIGTF